MCDPILLCIFSDVRLYASDSHRRPNTLWMSDRAHVSTTYGAASMLCPGSTSLCIMHVSVVLSHVDVVSRVDIVVCKACVGCSVTRRCCVTGRHRCV